MKIIEYSKNIDLDNVLGRNQNENNNIEQSVKDIIKNVKENGDKALKEYTKEFDHAHLDNLKVSDEEIERALTQIEPEILAIYKDAAENIKEFHEKQIEKTWTYEPDSGITLGQQITPIKEVGMYVPGGKAAYPSTVLMDSIPAKVAGVSRLVMVSPPDEQGKLNPYILAAAKIVGIDEIYKVGGAHAIAALAYGTDSIKPVNKIVGPGNIFVATAKKEVFGNVDIDMIAGPSEVLIIADDSANPDFIAADLLAQAEHDERAQSILITESRILAQRVLNSVNQQIENNISRKEIAKTSINNKGVIFIVNNLQEAFDLANQIAPEHLELNIKNANENVNKIENAGAIFIGENTPEPIGDYFAGPNHTLPTSGTAKFSSPLGVYDFLKKTSLINYSKEALGRIQKKVQKFAKSEGLDAHANSIQVRIGD